VQPTPACAENGSRCATDNDCCYGTCSSGLCAQGASPCKKTNEICAPGTDTCCSPDDTCRAAATLSSASVASCRPGGSPAPSPSPACKARGATCNPGTDTCCQQGDTCKLNPNVLVAASYWCAQGTPTPTTTPTPQCKSHGAACNPNTDSCCQAGDSCRLNPNVLVAASYWCAGEATPTPTPGFTYASCDDRNAAYGNEAIYHAGVVTDMKDGVYVQHYDYCANYSTLVEYSCNSVPEAQATEVYCQYGCTDGACNKFSIGGTPTPTPTYCTQTVTTNDYYARGTTTGQLATGGIGAFTDYCLDDTTLYKYYCASPGQTLEVLTKTVQCRLGCQNGACKTGQQ
jgi:hypothetical protein